MAGGAHSLKELEFPPPNLAQRRLVIILDVAVVNSDVEESSADGAFAVLPLNNVSLFRLLWVFAA